MEVSPMASRLYRTIRQLFLALERALLRLQLSSLGTPTLAALITLVVTGLILLDARPRHTRLARCLPARCHDAFNRLLCDMPFSTRALMALLLAFAKRLGRDGYLVLDDVIVEKARQTVALGGSDLLSQRETLGLGFPSDCVAVVLE
jgi:hypothetical protein